MTERMEKGKGKPRREDWHTNLVSKAFLQIVGLIVVNPNVVQCTIHESSTSYIFEITVDEQDYGKVIGKNGAMAKALRTIMRAIAGNYDKRLILEFSHSGKEK